MKDGKYSCKKNTHTHTHTHIDVFNDFFCAVSQMTFHTEWKWTNTLSATCPPEAGLNTVFISVGWLDLNVLV